MLLHYHILAFPRHKWPYAVLTHVCTVLLRVRPNEHVKDSSISKDMNYAIVIKNSFIYFIRITRN